MPTEPHELEVLHGEVLHGEIVEEGRAEVVPLVGQRLPGRAGTAGVQAAVAAATGFVAGAATVALMRRYGPARLERPAPGAALEPARPGPVRTYIVHVRQLG